MTVLQGKLEQIEEESTRPNWTPPPEARWTADGAQIRSYVIYDNRVKDHRTGHEVSNPQTVLGSELGGFIDADSRRRSERIDQSNSSSEIDVAARDDETDPVAGIPSNASDRTAARPSRNWAR